MASNLSPEVQDHAFVKAMAGFLDVALKRYLVHGVHNELEHGGTDDDCSECGPILRTLDTRAGEERERLYASMRDFADRFGY